MRVVLDTNIFISGIFWEGNLCSQIVNEWKKGRFELISSLEIIKELISTLKSFKIKLPDDIIKEWLAIIINNSIMVYPKEKLDIIKDDIDDNIFLEAGLSGSADYIVSQDKHLLNVKEFKGMVIVSPLNFLKIIKI